MDLNTAKMDTTAHNPGSSQSEESVLDFEINYCDDLNLPGSSPPPQAFASSGQLSESNAAYFSWCAARIASCAEDREHYFGNLQKEVLPEIVGRPKGLRASTLLELMTIKAFHSKILQHVSLGTAVGFRIWRGLLTDIPAILVFVARKIHKNWLRPAYCLLNALEVASQETYGTLGAIVKSRTGNKQVGFLTNRHVAVDLDYPSQKMFHPFPPCLGPGVFLGAVERATSFVNDDLWYGIFAGTNPETFVRADGAFIPFAGDFDMANVTTVVKGVGDIGDVHTIDLQSPIGSLVGRQVVKVGRSSGLTTGTIMAYSLEYNDEKGICFFTDFLVVGENQQTFDLEGDSGSLILLTNQNGEKPQPVGIIWGGTANRGRLKLKAGQPPQNWTSGVDLGRLLDLLELDLVNTPEGLRVALQEQSDASTPSVDSVVGECSALERANTKREDNSELLPPKILHISSNDDSHQRSMPPSIGNEFHIEEGACEVVPSVEHQFITNLYCKSLPNHCEEGERMNLRNLSRLRDESEDITVSLQLGKCKSKRRK